MGQMLTIPATQKQSEEGLDKKVLYGVSQMQGWRVSMEDAHTVALNLDDDEDDSNALFAVFDGHGGDAVAKYAGANVDKRLHSEPAYREKQYEVALKNTFLGLDDDLRANPDFKRDNSGCTAIAALLTKDGKIYVANAGDSRSVLSVAGRAKPMSYDHKPTNDSERSRIVAAGGFVEFGRANGNLALSRALGDFEYKKNKSLTPELQIITSDPEVRVHDVTEEDEFLVLACDGIWDCLTSQQVVDCVRLLISQGKELPQVCEEIMELCLAPDTSGGGGYGCDNMTILVVGLLHGRTKEEWYQWITDRVKQKHGYNTPDELPQLYSASRLAAAKVRRARDDAYLRAREIEREEAEERKRTDELGIPYIPKPDLGPDGQPKKSTRWDKAVSYPKPGTIVINTSVLMYGTGDSDEADEEDVQAVGSSTPKQKPTEVPGSLKAQIEELGEDWDGDAVMAESKDEEEESDMESEPELQGEAPPSPPKEVPGGFQMAQVQSEPGGDEASGAIRAESPLDTSESPLKT